MSKRKADLNENGDNSPKAKTVKEAIYSVIDFEVEIKDPASQFTAFENFLKQARSFPAECNYDIVSNYCTTSPEFQELFGVLEGGLRNREELKLIGSVFEHCLVRFAGDLEERYSTIGEQIGKRIITKHFSTFFSLLHANQPPTACVVLKLFTALNLQGVSCAREMLLNTDLQNKSLAKCFVRKVKSASQDVRACAIMFAMSFLMAGDSALIQQIMAVHGFLNDIFKGLKSDKLETIRVVFSTYLDKVLQNPDINKSLKTRVFTKAALRHIGSLYEWRRPIYEDDKDKDKDEEYEDQEGEVYSLTHEFLRELCCSMRHGVIFYDKTFGTTSETNHNWIVNGLLTSFRRPHFHQLQTELVVATLARCPDLLHWFLPSMVYLTNPKSPEYQTVLEFLQKIFEAQKPVSPALAVCKETPMDELVKMMIHTLLPPREVWINILRLIRMTDVILLHKALLLVSIILIRVHRTVSEFRELEPDRATEFQQKLSNSLKYIMPTWTSVLEAFTTLTREPPPSYKILPHIVEEDWNIIRTILSALTGYQQIVSVLETDLIPTLDCSVVLDGVQTYSTGLSERRRVELYMWVFQLLTHSSQQAIEWDSKQGASKKTFLCLLLEHVVFSTEHTEIHDMFRQCVVKMLSRSGAFEENQSEVDLWLVALTKLDRGAQDKCIVFLEKALLRMFAHICEYMEVVMNYCSESSLSGDATGSNQSEADEQAGADVVKSILAMPEILLDEGADADQEAFGGTDMKDAITTNRQLFSALLPCVCDILKRSVDKDQDLMSYVQYVVCAILRRQPDPAPLCQLVVEHTGEAFSERFVARIVEYLPKSQRPEIELPGTKWKPEKDDILGSTGLTRAVEDVFNERHTDIQSTEAFAHAQKSLKGMSDQQWSDVVRQLLLYIHTLIVVDDKVSDKNLECFFTLLHQVINQALAEIAKEKAEHQTSVPDLETNPKDDVEEPTEKSEEVEDTQNVPVFLRDEPKSTEQCLRECLVVLFSHQTIQQYFLAANEANVNKRTALVSRVLSRQVSVIVRDLNSTNNIPALDYFVARAEELLNSASSARKDLGEHVPVWYGFVHRFKPGALVEFIIVVSKGENKGKELVYPGLAVKQEDILRESLEMLLERNTVHFDSTFIPKEILLNILQLSLRKEVLTEILVNTFNAIPKYSNFVTKKLFKKYVASKSALVSAWVQHSAQCRAWYSQWYEENGDCLLQHDYAAITSDFIQAGRAHGEACPAVVRLCLDSSLAALDSQGSTTSLQEKAMEVAQTCIEATTEATAWLTQGKHTKVFASWLDNQATGFSDSHLYQLKTLSCAWKHSANKGSDQARRFMEWTVAVFTGALNAKKNTLAKEVIGECMKAMSDIVEWSGKNSLEESVALQMAQISQNLLEKIGFLKAGLKGDERVSFFKLLRGLVQLADVSKLSTNKPSQADSGKSRVVDKMEQDNSDSSEAEYGDGESSEEESEATQHAKASKSSVKSITKVKMEVDSGESSDSESENDSSDENNATADASSKIKVETSEDTSSSDEEEVDGGVEEDSEDDEDESDEEDEEKSGESEEQSLESSEEDSDDESLDEEENKNNNNNCNNVSCTVASVCNPTDLQERRVAVLNTLYERLISHSGFLPLMLDENEDVKPEKVALLDVLLAVVKQEPSVCKTEHVTLWFGAFSACLRADDIRLLALLWLYEKNGAKLSEYRPFLWGTKAIEHYKLRKDMASSLQRQATTAEVLALIDKDRMMRTALNFPLYRKLLDMNAGEADPACAESGRKRGVQLYDPCFLLPLFNSILSSENQVNCRHFVNCQCLGLVFTALSSHDREMRALAYTVLARFYFHLEGHVFAEQRQLLYLLELLRNSVPTPGMRIPALSTVFLAKCAAILIKPADHLYAPINNFLLCKPTLFFNDIPEFYVLFNSSAQEFDIERHFMLEMLGDGLREAVDWKSYSRRFALKITQALYDSKALSHQKSQNQVLRFLCKAVDLPSVAKQLWRDHGLGTWLSHLALQRSYANANSPLLIDLIHRLWSQLRDHGAEPTKLEGEQEPQSFCAETEKSLPHPVVQEMTHVTLAVLTNIRSFETTDDVMKLSNVLSSIVQAAHKEEDTASVKSEMKGTVARKMPIIQYECEPIDVLLLLYHWSKSMGSVSRGCAEFLKVAQELLEMYGKVEPLTAEKRRSLSNENKDISTGCFYFDMSLGEKIMDNTKLQESLVSIFQLVAWLPLTNEKQADHMTASRGESAKYTCTLAAIFCLQWTLQFALIVVDNLSRVHSNDLHEKLLNGLYLVLHQFERSSHERGGTDPVWGKTGAIAMMLQLLLGKLGRCKVGANTDVVKLIGTLEKITC